MIFLEILSSSRIKILVILIVGIATLAGMQHRPALAPQVKRAQAASTATCTTGADRKTGTSVRS